MLLGQLDCHLQKNEVGPLPCTVNQQCTTDLKARAKTIKPLEENRDINLCDLGLSSGVLDTTSGVQATEENLN